MPKFNRPLPPPTHDTRTAQGGPGFSREAKTELFLLGVANAVGEDTFYESGESRDKRFADLVREVTAEDPAWVRKFGAYLRSEGFMRSASVVLAAEYVAAGGPDARSLVDSVLQRADEPAELLAYWRTTHGRKTPMAIKRGIADAVRRLYTERNMLRWDGNEGVWRWGDVIEVTHPRPIAPWQGQLFRYAIDRRHGRDDPRFDPELLPLVAKDRQLLSIPQDARRGNLSRAVEAGWSWERLAGWLPGGMDAAAWEAIIPNMGLMALARNLRNFDKAGVSNATAAKITARFADREEVRRSRQFPFRFLTAWKAVSSTRWGLALESAIDLSTDNAPSLPGRTLILIDVSPSMDNALVSRHRGKTADAQPMRWEAAALFGLALARQAAHADVHLFDFNSERFVVERGASILRMAEQIRKRVVDGNGTDTLGALMHTFDGHDRVVILTDEQTGRGAPVYGNWQSTYGYGAVGDPAAWEQLQARIKVPVTTFNLAGYEIGHTPEYRNWMTVGGLTDACFGLVGAFEQRSRDRWPWDAPQKPQAVVEQHP